jgi:hypothetical protein
MRDVVVGDQMQRLVLGQGAIDPALKLWPLGMGASGLTLADNLSIEHIQRREQRGGAMAFVVVGHPLGTAFLKLPGRLAWR